MHNILRFLKWVGIAVGCLFGLFTLLMLLVAVLVAVFADDGDDQSLGTVRQAPSTPTKTATPRMDAKILLTATPLPTPTATHIPKPTPDHGRWEKFAYTDNLTGESKIGVRLTAVWSSEPSSFFKAEPAGFILSCHRNGSLIGIFVWPNEYIIGDLVKAITDDNNLPVEYLLDGVSYTDWWRTSGNDEFVTIPPDKLPTFLDRVRSASTLGIQVMDTDLWNNSQAARFKVNGLDWALTQLSCADLHLRAVSPTPTQQSTQTHATPTATIKPSFTPTNRPTSTTKPTPTLIPTPTPNPGGRWEIFTYADNLTGQSHSGVSLIATWSYRDVQLG